MKTDELLSILKKHPQLKRLRKVLATPAERCVRLEGLCGSAAPALFAALACSDAPSQEGSTLLFVLSDEEEAGYFYHDLMQFMDSGRVHFFPSSFRRAIRFNQRDAGNEVMRTEVLGLLSLEPQSPRYIVTYPEALAENVVSKQQLTERAISVRKGQTFDFSQLEEQLDDLGFQHVDYVYEPGQFAVRGSLIDIFSYSSDTPWRIDFFGDEVDSIRPFDVASQLSAGVLPADAQVVISPPVAPQAQATAPVLSFFPADTWLVAADISFICDTVRRVYQDGFSSQALAEDEEADFSGLVTEPSLFNASIAPFRSIILSPSATLGKADGQPVIAFSTSPQPLFHKQFELLERECGRWLAEGYRLCILADNPKQHQRIRDIFASHEVDLPFTAIEHTLHEGFIDHTLKLCVLTDHQIFDRFHKYSLQSDKVRRGQASMTLKELQQLQFGDYVVHMDYGIGRFGGLVNVPINGPGDAGQPHMQEMIKITYLGGDVLYVTIHSLSKISKYRGREGEQPRLSKLGSGAWERMKDRVKGKVKDIARDLIVIYAKRLKEKGFAFSKDTYIQDELEASFLYEDTPDQLLATQEVKADMEQPRPMDRLICGDVGFGKTEIAIRAAVKAVADGKQTAVLVPTTILAYQHFQTFSERLRQLPVRVDYLSRARSTKEAKETLSRLADGSTDIIIGTHKLIGKEVRFKDLGLLIIDEEQKFGVAVKEKLRKLKANIDTLTLTATPIPRTLQFSLMGARDLSILQTPPPNRFPIRTELCPFEPEALAEAIRFELSRNGQVFFVNNRISNLPELEAMIRHRVPDARVCVGHGQMDPKELERNVLGFINHDYDVLLATTIVENGIDVPNANTIIINNAQSYGLSDLHQMRGRVGRSNKRAFCYLITPPLALLPQDARRRLQAIRQFSDLGIGFNIAMQDLDIRGAGNMLGAEQSGFIADLGYETYQKVLAEAVAELRRETARRAGGGTSTDAAGSSSVVVETDIDAHFPEAFVPTSAERIALYRELDSFTTPAQLEAYRKRLVDRFGPLPPEAEELVRIIPLKWTAARLGVERVYLKQRRMMLFLPADTSSPYYQTSAFGALIRFATHEFRRCQFREKPSPSVVISGVATVKEALDLLNSLVPAEGENTRL